jgi:hypothetical protein
MTNIDKINEITTKEVLENGGKLWEKGTMYRVYVNAETFRKVWGSHFDQYQNFKGLDIGKSKLWMNKDGSLQCDNGSIRSAFNGTQLSCTA